MHKKKDHHIGKAVGTVHSEFDVTIMNQTITYDAYDDATIGNFKNVSIYNECIRVYKSPLNII